MHKHSRQLYSQGPIAKTSSSMHQQVNEQAGQTVIHSNARGLLSNRRCEVVMHSTAWSPLRGRKLSKSKYSVWLYVNSSNVQTCIRKSVTAWGGEARWITDASMNLPFFFLPFSIPPSFFASFPHPLLFFPLIQGFTISSSWFWTHFISQSNLKLAKKKNSTASVFQVLGFTSMLYTQLH